MNWFTHISRSPWYHAFWLVWCAAWAIGYAWAHEIFWMSFWIGLLLCWAFYIGKWLVHHTARPKFEFNYRGLTPGQLARIQTTLEAYPNADVKIKFTK